MVSGIDDSFQHFWNPWINTSPVFKKYSSFWVVFFISPHPTPSLSVDGRPTCLKSAMIRLTDSKNYGFDTNISFLNNFMKSHPNLKGAWGAQELHSGVSLSISMITKNLIYVVLLQHFSIFTSHPLAPQP